MQQQPPPPAPGITASKSIKPPVKRAQGLPGEGAKHVSTMITEDTRRRVKDITPELLREYFHMPISKAVSLSLSLSSSTPPHPSNFNKYPRIRGLHFISLQPSSLCVSRLTIFVVLL
jgi:hypothetical protein